MIKPLKKTSSSENIPDISGTDFPVNADSRVTYTREELLDLLCKKELYIKGLESKTRQLILDKESLEVEVRSFRDLTTFSTSGIYMTDKNGKCTFVNEVWCKMSGLTPDEAYGDGWILGIHPDDRDKIYITWNRFVGTDSGWNWEYRFLNKSGKITWVYGSAIPVKNEEGETTGYIGQNTDITDKILSDEKLRERDELFRILTENSPDHIIVNDNQLRYTYVLNPQLGLTTDEMIGRTDFELLEKEEAERLTRVKEEVLKSGQSIQYETFLISKTGNYEYFNGSFVPRRDRDNNINGLIGYFRNVTKQTIAEAFISEAESIAHLGSYEIGITEPFVKWSDETFRIFGMDPLKDSEPTVEEYSRMVHPEDSDRLFRQFNESILSKRDFDLKYRIIASDGSIKHVHSIGRIKTDGRGKIIMIGTFQDISECIKSEERMSEYQMAVNASYDLLAVVDRNFKYTMVNEAFLKKRGLRQENVVNHSVEEVLGKETFVKIKPRLDICFNGEYINYEMQYTYPKIGLRYLDVKYYPLKMDNCQVERVVSVISDITERKQAEMSLRESETRYRNFFENSAVPIWEEDFSDLKKFIDSLKRRKIKDFRNYFNTHPEKIAECASLIKIADVNQTSVKFFGGKSKTDIVRDLSLWFNEDSLKVFKEEIISLAEGKTEFESEIPVNAPDGSVKYLKFKLQVQSGCYDTLQKVLVSFLDITDRYRYEQVLKQSTDEMRNLAKHIEDAREIERREIALNLHDDLGQRLTALNMDIAWLKSRIGVQSRTVENKINQMVMMINDTIESVQKISFGLRPVILDDFGLIAAIQWKVTDFYKSSGLPCKFSYSPNEIKVDTGISLVVFRVIQEALTNIARYAGANKLSIGITMIKGILEVIINDNGRGITEEQINSNRSFGLIGMKERVMKIGGNIRITGKTGVGTEVYITIPVKEGEYVSNC